LASRCKQDNYRLYHRQRNQTCSLRCHMLRSCKGCTVRRRLDAREGTPSCILQHLRWTRRRQHPPEHCRTACKAQEGCHQCTAPSFAPLGTPVDWPDMRCRTRLQRSTSQRRTQTCSRWHRTRPPCCRSLRCLRLCKARTSTCRETPRPGNLPRRMPTRQQARRQQSG